MKYEVYITLIGFNWMSLNCGKKGDDTDTGLAMV
jgi:hypothetical protein